MSRKLSQKIQFSVLDLERKVLEQLQCQKAVERKECINFECKSKKSVTFHEAELSVLSYFNVSRKLNQKQFVCQTCRDECLKSYKRLNTVVVNGQPLLMQKLPSRSVFVDLSTDEEDGTAGPSNYVDDSQPLPSDMYTFLLNNLDEVFNSSVKAKMDQQVSWTNQILKDKIKKNKATSDKIDAEIKSLQKIADSMYVTLYRHSNSMVEELPPYDLNENKPLNIYGPTYPPIGEILYPSVNKNSLYYAVRATLLTTWIPCKVIEQIQGLVNGVSCIIQFI